MKKIVLLGSVCSLLLPLIFIIVLFSSGDDKKNDIGGFLHGGSNLSSEVLAHRSLVEEYCLQYGISDYVMYILAIMQVESGGVGNDVMQASESLGLPPNTLDVEESIEQGCKYFSELLTKANQESCDINTVVQAYNYGIEFVLYVSQNGGVYTFELSQNYALEQSGGEKVEYTQAIAVSVNGGWRYDYGNMFYVKLVSQYLVPDVLGNEVYQVVMSEALKFQGWKYVFGGDNPNSSFDCSGLTMWCYQQAGISLPRIAQDQYETTTHITLDEAQAGDLVFFHSTYNAGSYVTHVGIYCGNMMMYHAGDPIGYADLTSSYWQEHFICAGRIKY